MKHLKFKHKFVKEIIEGRKTTTWRLFDDKNLSVGDKLNLIDNQTGGKFTKAIISNIKEKEMEDLTEEELRNHNYGNVEKMIESHKKYYGNKISLNTVAKIVEFKLIK